MKHSGIVKEVHKEYILCWVKSLEKNIKVHKKYSMRAMLNDSILLKVNKHGYGIIIKINSRYVEGREFIGRICIKNDIAFIKPVSEKVSASFYTKKTEDIKDGDYVKFIFRSWEKSEKSPTAYIIEKTEIGDSQLPIYKFNIKTEFSDDIKKQSSKIEMPDMNGRKDYRDLLTIACDPEDTKEFDDAISFENTEKGYRVGIHIADVSYFVKPGTSTDIEAYSRGYSIYMPDRTVPMLPDSISNDKASLIEGKDRPSVSIMLDFDFNWTIISTEINRSIIRVNKNLTYQQAYKHMEDTGSWLYSMLNTLYIYGMKHRKVLFPKEISFDTPDIEFEKVNGVVSGFHIKKRLKSMDMVQSWMLIANKVATLTAEKHDDYKWIYRIQKSIPNRNIDNVRSYLKTRGFEWDELKHHNENIFCFMKDCSFTDREVLIKSMCGAEYSAFKKYHFSVGTSSYCHFTSPLRRYTDIINHRILIGLINNNKIFIPDLNDKCRYLNKLDQRADDISKEYDYLISLDFVDINQDVKCVVVKENKKYYCVKTSLGLDAYLEKIQKHSLGDVLDLKVKSIDKYGIHKLFVKYRE